MSENNTTIEKVEEIKHIEITVDYALAQIEKIREDTQHIQEALYALRDVQSKGPGDMGAQGIAQGIADVVRCRETTNQQLIAFYTKIYEELSRPKKQEWLEKIEMVKSLQISTLSALSGCYDEDEMLERADMVYMRIDGYCNQILGDMFKN